MPRGIWREVKGRLGPLPGRALVVVGALLGAGLTIRLPIVTVIVLLAALDLGLLIYWFRVRAETGQRGPRTPMRGLARVLSAVGVVLIVNAVWLMILGFLTEFGITNETTANWGGLAAIGLQVTADDPSAFGARCLVVAAAVWSVGFGLAKAAGEKA